jgi:hypothetical protein
MAQPAGAKASGPTRNPESKERLAVTFRLVIKLETVYRDLGHF